MQPLDPDRLYLERASPVEHIYSLFTGDVFEHVDLPGLERTDATALVVMHPCTLDVARTKSGFVTVVPVELAAEPINNRVWNSHLKKMPLPELREDEVDHFGDFMSMTSVKASRLDPNNRVASLSDEGVVALMQRLICHMTRMRVETPVLRQQMLSVLVEREVQADWVETASPSGSPHEQDRAAKAFQEWLGKPDDPKSWRSALGDGCRHAALRRAAREAARG